MHGEWWSFADYLADFRAFFSSSNIFSMYSGTGRSPFFQLRSCWRPSAYDRDMLARDREPIRRRIRATPLEGVELDPVFAADPEARETIRDTVEDALAGRQPRW